MASNTNTHEYFTGQDAAVKRSSDRSFGIVFAVVFVLIGLWPLIDGEPARPWSLIVATFFVSVALIRPQMLAPLNYVWTEFGLLLHKITNPVIMGLVFYVAVTPTALVMRVLGKDPLRRRFDKSATTYWINRRPPGPQPETMQQQF